MSTHAKRTLLVIGAHMDDCELGAGGLIAKAVKKGHRVVLVICASDYSNYEITKGREKEVMERILKKAAEIGVEKRFLGYGYHQIPTTFEAIKKLAEVVVDVCPDITVFHNRYDHHPDHAAVAYIAERAVRDATCVVKADAVFSYEMYTCEIGPCISEFLPDTYIDISEDFAEVVRWANYFDEIYAEIANHPANSYMKKVSWLRACAEGPRSKIWIKRWGEQPPVELWSHAESKLAMALYRGAQGGAKFAEAYKAVNRGLLGRSVLQEIAA